MNFPAQTQSPLTPQETFASLTAIQEAIEVHFVGKPKIVRFTIASMLAGGSVLLEDVPGVGKTTLATLLAQVTALDFRRIQFTSDLLPSDIVGVNILNQKDGDFAFKPGPIFANVLLADEINRTTPRTQSALLEAMSERRVTVDSETYELPDPFVVVATQNPREHYGTYPLPESQLDRFLMRLTIGYPGTQVEKKLLKDRVGSRVPDVDPVIEEGTFRRMMGVVDTVRVEDSIIDYVMAVVEKTRTDDRVRIGVSPRGGLALVRAIRAYALTDGRDFALPDDARALFSPVFAHRLSLRATDDIAVAEEVIQELVRSVEIPV